MPTVEALKTLYVRLTLRQGTNQDILLINSQCKSVKRLRTYVYCLTFDTISLDDTVLAQVQNDIYIEPVKKAPIIQTCSNFGPSPVTDKSRLLITLYWKTSTSSNRNSNSNSDSDSESASTAEFDCDSSSECSIRDTPDHVFRCRAFVSSCLNGEIVFPHPSSIQIYRKADDVAIDDLIGDFCPIIRIRYSLALKQIKVYIDTDCFGDLMMRCPYE